jgi:hypothetical protein
MGTVIGIVFVIGVIGWVGFMLEAHERLRKAVIEVIALDRLLIGKDCVEAYSVELLEGDSVMVADLLRGLGVEIGDYP